jgi:hypothetical protein
MGWKSSSWHRSKPKNLKIAYTIISTEIENNDIFTLLFLKKMDTAKLFIASAKLLHSQIL